VAAGRARGVSVRGVYAVPARSMPAVRCCYPADADGAHCAAVQYQGTSTSVPPHACMAGRCAVRRVCACTCSSSGGSPADGAACMQLCCCEACTWAADSPTIVCSCSVFVVKLFFEPLESPGVARPRVTANMQVAGSLFSCNQVLCA
jgi:hypothetical protein